MSDIVPIQPGSLRQRWAMFLRASPAARYIFGILGIGVCWEAFQFGLGYMSIKLPFGLASFIAFVGFYGLLYLAFSLVTLWSAWWKHLVTILLIMASVIALRDQLREKLIGAPTKSVNSSGDVQTGTRTSPEKQTQHEPGVETAATKPVTASGNVVQPTAKSTPGDVAKSAGMLINCQPRINLGPSNEPLYIINGENRVTSYRGSVSESDVGKHGVTSLWSCEGKYYGEAPLVNVSVGVHVKFLALPIDDLSSTSSGGSMDDPFDFTLYFLQLDRDNIEKFYIGNKAKFPLVLSFSGSGKGTSATDGKDRSIKILVPDHDADGLIFSSHWSLQ